MVWQPLGGWPQPHPMQGGGKERAHEAVRMRNRWMASRVRCEYLSCTLLRSPHPAPLHTRLAPAVEQRVRYASSPTALDTS